MPKLADLKMKSPTGVADFVQVSQGEIEKNFNNSFSWVECPIEVDAPSSDRNAKKIGIAERMQRIEQRLKWLEHQSSKDKQDLFDQLRKAKAKVREEIYQRYEPLLKKSNDNYDGQVMETSKIINYLRDDNAKLREEINGLKRNIAKLTKANKELEAANASALASHADLENHVEGLEAVQDKLNNNCRILKQALAQMKQDYTKRSAFYHMESNTVSMYELCLAKVLTQVQKSPKGSSLQQDIFRIAQEGADEIATGREEQLKKFGLTMDQRQRKQTEMLKNPELLIAAQKRLLSRSSDDDDSDSDSDSDDSDSSSSSSSDSDDEYELDSDDDEKN